MLVRLAVFLFVVGRIGLARTHAEGLWFSFHEASGSGTANVFDGGPLVANAGSTFDPSDPDLVFGALDLTRPGSLGAIADGGGTSRIFSVENGMDIRVALTAGYFPSLFPGGDNPGGMAEAELSSVIEFVMPVDEINWAYQLLIDEMSPFSGSTSVVFENVTQSETVLTLTEEFLGIETTLSANAGDLMRISTTMSGSGTMGPGSTREYETAMVMVFTIPEPSTLALLALGAAGCLRRKRHA